jgi:DNA-binding response OmpR family regulator
MRVLVVEDYDPLRKATCRGLRQAGFAVDVAADGNEGLWLATSGEYDVIVLDLMLPGIEGIEILKRLRQSGRQSHVLVLTARDALEDRVKGLNLGADDYLVKPFAFEELVARIRALVRRKYGAKNPVIRVGSLEIDTSTRAARQAGEPLDLTAREYALLEFLALRAGEIVSRSDIWEHVYDFHSTAQSNVVDVYIGYLRKKLSRAGVPRLIHTRRGQGYVLGEKP